MGAKMVVLLAAAAGAVLAGYHFFRGGIGAEPEAAPAVATGPAKTRVDPQGFQPLIGRWRRPDGGYVIDIRGVDAAGKIDAGYFNPRPINIARAQASRDVDGLKVFIELQDVGYPGATYSLIHNSSQNVLEGLYYQPTAGQTFEVVFVPLDKRTQTP